MAIQTRSIAVHSGITVLITYDDATLLVKTVGISSTYSQYIEVTLASPISSTPVFDDKLGPKGSWIDDVSAFNIPITALPLNPTMPPGWTWSVRVSNTIR